MTNGNPPQAYQTFRPLNRNSPSTTSVPNLTLINSFRRNSNSSSNEADEELSLSSMNSNQLVSTTMNITDDNGIGIYMTPSLSLSTTNMSTFKSVLSATPIPAKPSDVKRRSNQRKQIYATLQSSSTSESPKTNENETPAMHILSPPPPPPPLPDDLRSKKNEISPRQIKSNPPVVPDFQRQIEQARTNLKKITRPPTHNSCEIQIRSHSKSKQNYHHSSGKEILFF